MCFESSKSCGYLRTVDFVSSFNMTIKAIFEFDLRGLAYIWCCHVKSDISIGMPAIFYHNRGQNVRTTVIRVVYSDFNLGGKKKELIREQFPSTIFYNSLLWCKR